jgi:hypothetical protein
MTFPNEVQINAWADGEVRGDLDPALESRILGRGIEAKQGILPAPLTSQTEWQHRDVGWGLVLPENTALAAKDRAHSSDAPQPIRDLHELRGGPIFRVGPDWRPGTLRRYYPDGSAADIAVGAGMIGTGKGRIPRYLLIAGGPEIIPWEVQYDLHYAHFVGRLDLERQGLRHYVDALLRGWSERAPQKPHSLIWSVDHGSHDITHLLRRAIGLPMHKRFANDPDPKLVAGARYLDKSNATNQALANAIKDHRPALIVTTSHGNTAPLNDTDSMRTDLGLLVDAAQTCLDPADLGGDYAPSGAVWLAQACCSAGSTATSGYDSLLTPGSKADNVLKAVAACGNTTARLPRTLLGSRHPLAAFVGHIEPTFDWTIRHPETNQFMSASLLGAFHQLLFSGHPVGMAIEEIRKTSGSFLTSYDIAKRRLINDQDHTQLGPILALQLAARDWQSIVLLGDPTVTVYP